MGGVHPTGLWSFPGITSISATITASTSMAYSCAAGLIGHVGWRVELGHDADCLASWTIAGDFQYLVLPVLLFTLKTTRQYFKPVVFRQLAKNVAAIW